jgi:hypothetical protein
MHSSAGLIVLVLGALAACLVAWFVRRRVSPEEAADWPVTEGTIQSVGIVPGGRSSPPIDVCNFSYVVNDEYYSGRLALSRPNDGRLAVCRPFTSEGSPKDLINQKIQVSYNPRKPEKYSVSTTECGNFLLDPCDELLGQEIGPIDLNINNG